MCGAENGIEYGDLPKFVDFEYAANVARLNAATLASLASAPAPPEKVRLSIARQENQSTIEWEPSPDGRAAGYQVLVACNHQSGMGTRALRWKYYPHDPV